MAYASKLKTKNQGNVPIGSNLFGTCSTASGTTQKDVSLSDFNVLVEGVTVHVHFDNENTAATPTLKVGGTSAKSIVNPDWSADSVVSFTYHSNKWYQNDFVETEQADWDETDANSPSYIQNKPNYAGSPTQGGIANKAMSIPVGKIDATSTAKVMTATVNGVNELRDGICCYIMNGVVTSATGWTLDVNGLGAKPVYSTLALATQSTNTFNINYTMLFVYNEDRVAGGCWDMFYGYDSNSNTIGYQLRTNSMTLPTTDKFYRYRLLFTSADGTHFVPANTSTSTNATAVRTANQRKIDPFGRIVYNGGTAVINAEATPISTVLWSQYAITLGYSFNTTGSALTLTFPKPVYIKCSPQSDGSAIIDATTPYVQDLPTTEDGYIYIFLGVAYSATQIELIVNHPVYYYKNGAIRPWTNATSNVSAQKVTLTANGWSGNSQTVTVNGVTATSIVMVQPNYTSYSDYVSDGIQWSGQGTNSLTFTCNSIPSSDIDVNVIIGN